MKVVLLLLFILSIIGIIISINLIQSSKKLTNRKKKYKYKWGIILLVICIIFVIVCISIEILYNDCYFCESGRGRVAHLNRISHLSTSDIERESAEKISKEYARACYNCSSQCTEKSGTDLQRCDKALQLGNQMSSINRRLQ